MERKWWTLLASCIAIFMLLLDVTIVNVALPSIERSLGANFTDLQWVIDAYALTLAGVLLAAGSLADKVGRRLVFMLGLAIFTASSLACGLAPDPLFLQVSRAAQGIGGAMMFGTSLALIAQEFQGRERGTALGIWGATTALAVSTGPLVGGAHCGRVVVALDLPRERADRRGRARGRAVAVARVARPGRLRRRPAWRGAAVPRALSVRLRADPRQRGGLGERPDHQLLRGLRTAAGAVRGGRAPRRRPAARPLAVPKAGLHGRHDRRLRAVGVDLLDVSLHHALLPERAGLLAVAGGAAVAAGHHADPVRLAAERSADGARAGAAAARDGARVRDRRAAADGEPVRLVGVDRAAAGPDPGRDRDRPGHPRAGLDRRRRGPPAAERHGVGREQHGSPTRARHRDRRPRLDLPIEDRVDAHPAGRGYARVVARPRACAGCGVRRDRARPAGGAARRPRHGHGTPRTTRS